MTTTKQHPPEKDAKHHDKPAEKAHKEEPKRAPDREPAKQRVLMKNPGGDEVVVTHGTESYHIPRDGEADLPPHVAEHVIRQGGAKAINPKDAPLQGTIQIQNVSDPKAIIGYGDQTYQPDATGIMTVPYEMSEESDLEAHGFIQVPQDGSRGK
jgi:hypothetical protein